MPPWCWNLRIAPASGRRWRPERLPSCWTGALTAAAMCFWAVRRICWNRRRGIFFPCPAPGRRWIPCVAPVSLRSLVLIYNSRLIRQNFPTGLHSLLEEAWRGQIAFADPENSDFSRTALAVRRQEMGEEGLSRFAANLSTLLPDTRSVIESVADGSFCLALVPEDAALRAVAEGASLTVVYPSEGVYRIALSAAIPSAAPHPDNAAAFLAFLQGEDAQRYSLEKSFLDPVLESLGSPAGNEVFFDAAAAGKAQASLMALWRAGWEETP